MGLFHQWTGLRVLLSVALSGLVLGPVLAEDRITLKTQFQDILPKYLDLPDGTHSGISWEIMQLIERKSPIRFSYVAEHVPLIRVANDLSRGVTDIQVGIQKTPERERTMVFGEALYRVQTVAVCRSDDRINFTSLADLGHLGPQQGLILTVWGTGIAQILAVIPGLHIDDQAKSAEAGLKKLVAKRGRVFIYHNLSTVYLLRNREFADQLRLVDIEYDNADLDDAWQYVCFSRNVSPAVMEMVNQVIREARQNGELAAITDKYLK